MDHRIHEGRAQLVADVGDQVAEMIDGDDDSRYTISRCNRLVHPPRDEFSDGGTELVRTNGPRSQCSRGRSKDIPAMEGRTRSADAETHKSARIEMPQTCGLRPCYHLGQQAVIRCQKEMPIEQHHRDIACRADARIDHGDVDRALGKISVGARQPESGLGGPVRKNLVGQIDETGHGRRAENPAFHHPDERITQAEVGGQRDDATRCKTGCAGRGRVAHGAYGIIDAMAHAAQDPTRSFRLDGRIALVTGASSGIGRALAIAFAQAGASVALAARRLDRLNDVAATIASAGGVALPVALDVTKRAAIAAAFDTIQERLGVPDVILNNAGIAEPALFLKTDDAALESTMATNFTAAWQVSQEAARRLVAAGRGGSIINITSILGMGTSVGYAAYAASKAALAHATRTMAIEFVRYGIRVNAIAPGWFVTEMNEDFFATPEGAAYLKRTPPGRAGRLEELTGPALLLASEAGSFINGTILPVDGGHHVALV